MGFSVRPTTTNNITPNGVCPKLSEPSNGGVTCTNGNKPGSMCAVVCKPGFSLKGKDVTTCGSSGAWTHFLGHCAISGGRGAADSPVNADHLLPLPLPLPRLADFPASDPRVVSTVPAKRMVKFHLDRAAISNARRSKLRRNARLTVGYPTWELSPVHRLNSTRTKIPAPNRPSLKDRWRVNRLPATRASCPRAALAVCAVTSASLPSGPPKPRVY